MTTTQPVTPRPAAAVVVAREGKSGIEVFMVRRHIRSEFVPDAFVFPGGSVKDEDAAVERVPGICAPSGAGPTTLGSGYRAAALRECFEEAGVLLARHGAEPLAIPTVDVERFAMLRSALFEGHRTLADVAHEEGLTLATDQLLHWAHWITPAAFPKRFDTHFFLAAMPDQQEAAHDQLETTAGVWIAPQAALAGFARGEFPIVFATIHQLQELAQLERLEDAWQRFGGRVPRTIMPRVVQRHGADVIVLPDEE